MNKKRFFSFILALMLFMGIGFTQNAYAGTWEKQGTQWKYYVDYIYKLNWQLVDGKWYYFDKSTGFMKVGWIYDENYAKWYYLNADGSLDNSKTTQYIPEELSTAKNKIEQYSKENITYSETVSDGEKVSFKFLPQSQSQYKYGTPEYYFTPSTGKVFELTEGILVRLDVSEVINAKYTFEQCKSMASMTFSDSQNSGYKYTVSSDGVANKWGEYYFEFYSSETNQKIDAFYVSSINGAIRR